jgi:NAD(P)-dependent dehydrogenase (short-subunit alcohol dehydrogenase family)
MAARFAAEGMQVVIADIEQGALDATAAEVGCTGRRTDVTSADDVEALAAEVVERFGRVDLLCNNAGVGGGGRLVDTTLNDWRWVIGVNLWGVVHGLHWFLPHLVANSDGGHIVNTASMAGLTAPPLIGPYNASKHAVVAISETLRRELSDDGIPVGVSVLCPGFVATNIFTSQRNRPNDLRNPEAKVEARAFNDELVRIVQEQAIPPAQVADYVLDAVVGDRFWIFTHPDLVGQVATRYQEILQAAGLQEGDGGGADPWPG